MGTAVSSESAESPRVREEPGRDAGHLPHSITGSLTILGEQLRQSEVPSLVKVAELLQENGADLATYLSADSKGNLIPRFLVQLATHLTREQELLRRECEQLARDTEQLAKAVGLEPSHGVGLSRKPAPPRRAAVRRPPTKVEHHRHPPSRRPSHEIPHPD